eukprot:1261550-Pyramimonas_sp.AAC.1
MYIVLCGWPHSGQNVPGVQRVLVHTFVASCDWPHSGHHTWCTVRSLSCSGALGIPGPALGIPGPTLGIPGPTSGGNDHHKHQTSAVH